MDRNSRMRLPLLMTLLLSLVVFSGCTSDPTRGFKRGEAVTFSLRGESNGKIHCREQQAWIVEITGDTVTIRKYQLNPDIPGEDRTEWFLFAKDTVYQKDEVRWMEKANISRPMPDSGERL